MADEALNQYDQIADRLPSSALAVPHLTARERRLLFEAKDCPSLSDANAFATGRTSNRLLSETFNTDLRHSRLEKALTDFRSITSDWLEGNHRDDRFTWLLPGQIIPQHPGNEPVHADLRSLLQEKIDRHYNGDLATRLADIRHLEQWLPYVSIRLCYRLNNFRRSDFSTIRAVLGKGANFLNYPTSLRPWDADYPLDLGCLPARWLFIHDKSERLETLILRLEKCGLTNVMHLAVFYPPAFDFLKGTDTDQLIPLLQAFKAISRVS